MEFASVTDYLDQLQKTKLFNTTQMNRVCVLADAFTDAKEFSDYLVEHEFLTSWQANRILEGKQHFFIGRYRLLSKLGEGGMGAVFKVVEEEGLQRVFALKLLSKKRLTKPTALKRFMRELRALGAVSHPNIVTAYDADQIADSYFMILEYIPGRDLKKWVKRNGRLPIAWTAECIRQAALGLQHADERGVLHRDIKPGNLLVTADDTDSLPFVKILDLGLARLEDAFHDSVLTKTGQILGSVHYISPEQVEDHKKVDIRSDIFSLGCTFFYALTTQVPFPGENIAQRLTNRLKVTAPLVSTIRPEVPPELDQIIAKMLARHAEDRFQTPQELADALVPFAMNPPATQLNQVLERSKLKATALERSDLNSSDLESSTISGSKEVVLEGADPTLDRFFKQVLSMNSTHVLSRNTSSLRSDGETVELDEVIHVADAESVDLDQEDIDAVNLDADDSGSDE